MGFTHLHLIYRVEGVLPSECEIPSIHLVIELLSDTTPLEKRLVQLEHIDKNQRVSLHHNEAQKKQNKASFDRTVTPQSFTIREFVLHYDVSKDILGLGKFERLWKGPYIIKHSAQGGIHLSKFEWNLPKNSH